MCLNFIGFSVRCIHIIWKSLKAAVLHKIILKLISYKYFKIFLQKYIIVVRNKKKLHIPSINNGYCVSNAVDYAKNNNVLLTILSTKLGVSIIDFSTEHNWTSIYR